MIFVGEVLYLLNQSILVQATKNLFNKVNVNSGAAYI